MDNAKADATRRVSMVKHPRQRQSIAILCVINGIAWIPGLMSLSENIRKWARNLKRDAVTLWFACKHVDTPFIAKLFCVFVVAYALSPIDLIPDFIPVLGYLDDVILLPCLIWIAVRLVPGQVLADCRSKATEWIAEEGQKPSSNWGILLVVLAWSIATWALWKYLVTLSGS